MSKFEKVNNELIEKTRNSENWVKLTRNVDAGHKGKYALENIITHSVSSSSYATLDEIIKKFDLDIK